MGGIGDRAGVVVRCGDDGHAQGGRGLAEQRRQLRGGERCRVGPQAGPVGAYAEHKGQAAPRQLIGHCAGLPVDKAGICGRAAYRHR